jgi:hypothetical protein
MAAPVSHKLDTTSVEINFLNMKELLENVRNQTLNGQRRLTQVNKFMAIAIG